MLEVYFRLCTMGRRSTLSLVWYCGGHVRCQCRDGRHYRENLVTCSGQWRLSVWDHTLVISGLGEMQILPLYHCNIHKNNQRKWFQCRNGDFTEFPPYCRTSGGGSAWCPPATARRPCSAAPAAGCWWRLPRRSPAAGLPSCCTEPLPSCSCSED